MSKFSRAIDLLVLRKMAKNYVWNKWPLKLAMPMLIHSKRKSFFKISREIFN
ncbi:hypothetical protein T4D_7379 [Trichinella pseudospiralis]|uniref:Uncharacterized protein n=1 Tax=Trichinella pseudospiralis TaxID=6337 RepID=A0A0V1DK82_TRIPS|nr:hypothetical protein T4D_7379 [Trichinella pseudospiralis]